MRRLVSLWHSALRRAGSALAQNKEPLLLRDMARSTSAGG